VTDVLAEMHLLLPEHGWEPARFPARFQLVAATNPCRLGWASLPTCSPASVLTTWPASHAHCSPASISLDILAMPYAGLTAAAAGEPLRRHPRAAVLPTPVTSSR
jgi:hypothetical protein